MRKSMTMAAAGTLFAAALLTGCGGGDDDKKASGGGDYCDTLKSAAKNIASFTADGATPDFTQFQQFLDDADKLADEAPGEVKDDWKIMTDTMDELTVVLEDAGLSIEQFGELATTGQLPEGVDPAKLAELAPKLEEFGSEDLNDAGDSIEKHAKSECDVDLTNQG